MNLTISAAKYFVPFIKRRPILWSDCVLNQQRRHAGHSKWANIKNVKGLKDGQRAKDLGKITNMMRVAIREGGSGDPKSNRQLAKVISQAKDLKLPMAAVEKVLQTAQSAKDGKGGTVFVKGPGGCVLIVDINSPALNRSKQEINAILRKNKGTILTEGTSYFYVQKGVIRCPAVNEVLASPESLEKAVDDGIEAGAEEVSFQEDLEHGKFFEFITEPEPSSFFKVKQTLEKMNYTIGFSDLEYLPVNKVELSDNELSEASVLCDRLEGHPDVVRVFDNIA